MFLCCRPFECNSNPSPFQHKNSIFETPLPSPPLTTPPWWPPPRASMTRTPSLENWEPSPRTRCVPLRCFIFLNLTSDMLFYLGGFCILSAWSNSDLVFLFVVLYRSVDSDFLRGFLFSDVFWLQCEESNVGICYVWDLLVHRLLGRPSESRRSRQLRQVILICFFFFMLMRVSRAAYAHLGLFPTGPPTARTKQELAKFIDGVIPIIVM